MSQENLDAVRGLYEAFARDDLAAVFACFAHDVELDASMSRIPGGGVHVGHGGLRRFWSRWLGAWEEVHSEVIDLTAHGNRVMGEQRLHGTSRQGGVKVDAVVYDVFTLKDGLIVRHALFSEREPAERALEG